MADTWLVSILLQDSIGNEKCHLPDVRFGTVFIDLVTNKKSPEPPLLHNDSSTLFKNMFVVLPAGKEVIHYIDTCCFIQ